METNQTNLSTAQHTPERVKDIRAALVKHGGKTTVKANVRSGGALVYQGCHCKTCDALRVELAKATGSAA